MCIYNHHTNIRIIYSNSFPLTQSGRFCMLEAWYLQAQILQGHEHVFFGRGHWSSLEFWTTPIGTTPVIQETGDQLGTTTTTTTTTSSSTDSTNKIIIPHHQHESWGFASHLGPGHGFNMRSWRNRKRQT